MATVLLIGTLDTKGPEVAYLRDRVRALGVATIVADSGILGEPLDIVPDVTRAEVAVLAGTNIEALRNAGSRGKAVHGMLAGLRRLAQDLYGQGRLDGVAAIGGAEGAVLGASAVMGLPIGVPKIIVTPIASGHRRFGPLVGTRDVMVVHSVVDILGINPISQAVFDNVAAALAGMAMHAKPLQFDARTRRVGITMLGNTTQAVMMIRDALEARPRPDELRPAPVLLLVLLRVLDDRLDLRVREPAGRRDDDLLLALGREVAGGDVDDAVAVDVEGDLDLGGPLRGGRHARPAAHHVRRLGLEYRESLLLL